MLRAFASTEGVYNVDQLFLERQKALAAQTPSKTSCEVVLRLCYTNIGCRVMQGGLYHGLLLQFSRAANVWLN